MEYKKERIKGYEDYQVDTDGVIYAKSGRPLAYSISSKGYCIINLFKNGEVKGFSVHSIVARQFIPNDNPCKIQINHKDGNKINNNVDNLEWVTRSENVRHSIDVLGSHIGSKNANSKAIACYDKNTGELKHSFESVMDAAKYLCEGQNLRYVQNSICRALKGRRKTYRGYIWEYLS